MSLISSSQYFTCNGYTVYTIACKRLGSRNNGPFNGNDPPISDASHLTCIFLSNALTRHVLKC